MLGRDSSLAEAEMARPPTRSGRGDRERGAGVVGQGVRGLVSLHFRFVKRRGEEDQRPKTRGERGEM